MDARSGWKRRESVGVADRSRPDGRREDFSLIDVVHVRKDVANQRGKEAEPIGKNTGDGAHDHVEGEPGASRQKPVLPI
jgi:hypothetical protein